MPPGWWYPPWTLIRRTPIAIPIFWEGKIVGFSANTAHHIDIGSATPGLIIDIPDVFAEGMLFAGIKLYEKGKPPSTAYLAAISAAGVDVLYIVTGRREGGVK